MRADVNNDLLLGLLALQVGLIDSSALNSAFRTWTRDKLRPMADHLGHLEPESHEAAEGILALHLKKARQRPGSTEATRSALVGDPSPRRERMARRGSGTFLTIPSATC
jgi:eukaryotic-like serine/threonine-protein kinase